jgi:enamine deaminase RidA (YjgF/YER057c/UK114 family)
MAPDRELLDAHRNGSAPQDRELPEAVPGLLGFHHHTRIGYDGATRLALMVTPESGGDFNDQAWEAVSTIRAILRQQDEPMVVTMQTVFVRDAADVPSAQKLFEAYYGERMPLTLFVVQPPCDGRALAIEAWAISTQSAKVEFLGPKLVTVRHGDARWLYAASGKIRDHGLSAYEQSAAAFNGLNDVLEAAGASFEDVARIWLYHGNITELEKGTERYRELNRARTDFFAGVPFAQRDDTAGCVDRTIYPASTGIGTLEHGLVTTCLALETERTDKQFLALENPLQTPSFDYPEQYSIKSPKFSRAMALRLGNHVTTWVSGTASIVDSETVHIGDVGKQTEQTLTNIERLIDADNFTRLGWPDAGATLDDLAKVRVYVKHPEDYEKCREVVERRLGTIPAIYAVADVCRPDLLVEIEGVAFSPIHEKEDQS